jgi:hypothetical protein
LQLLLGVDCLHTKIRKDRLHHISNVGCCYRASVKHAAAGLVNDNQTCILRIIRGSICNRRADTLSDCALVLFLRRSRFCGDPLCRMYRSRYADRGKNVI